MQPKDTNYHRNLPHIHPEGFPLFITFRLADSLPLNVLQELAKQREHELNTSKHQSPDEIYKIEKKIFGLYDKWLDRCESGPGWLKETEIANLVMDKIHSMHDKYMQVMACCIMPNHVHLLIKSIINPSCYLPKEVDTTSQDKQSNLDFKTSGSDSMNGFW